MAYNITKSFSWRCCSFLLYTDKNCKFKGWLSWRKFKKFNRVPHVLFNFGIKKNVRSSPGFPPLYRDFYSLLIGTSIDHSVPRLLWHTRKTGPRTLWGPRTIWWPRTRRGSRTLRGHRTRRGSRTLRGHRTLGGPRTLWGPRTRIIPPIGIGIGIGMLYFMLIKS